METHAVLFSWYFSSIVACSVYIQMTIITTLHDPIALGRDDCNSPTGPNVVDQRIGIVAFVGQYRVCLQTVEQRFDLRYIGHLATAQQPAYWIVQCIIDCMNLGCQSAERAANRLRTFLSPGRVLVGARRRAVGYQRLQIAIAIDRCDDPSPHTGLASTVNRV